MPLLKWPKHFPMRIRPNCAGVAAEVSTIVDEICRYRRIDRADFLDGRVRTKELRNARTALVIVLKDRFRTGKDSPRGFSMPVIADFLGFARSSMIDAEARWSKDEGAETNSA